MRPVNAQHADRFTIDIRQLLAALDRGDLHDAARRALEFAGGGYPTGSDGPGSTDVSRPTEAAVLAMSTARTKHDRDVWSPDPTDMYAQGLRNKLVAAEQAVLELMRQMQVINSHGGDPDKEAESRLKRPALGAGNCRRCDCNATGVGDDRLRGGLCDACRKRFERDPARWGHDRTRYIAEGRRELKEQARG